MQLDEEYVDTIDAQDEDAASAVQDALISNTIEALKPNVPITVSPNATLARTINQMNRHNIGCMVVTDDDSKMLGIFTEKDVLMRVTGVVDDLTSVRLNDFMTADPIAIKLDEQIAHAVHLMSVHGFRHLPIVDDDDRPTGIISFRDVVEYLSATME
ncbi:MAG: CBS domain-containing protein [Chloroflexota bacterium]